MNPLIKAFSVNHHRIYGVACGAAGIAILGCSYLSAIDARIFLGGVLFAISSILIGTGLIYLVVPAHKMFRWIDPPEEDRTPLWKASIIAASLFLLIGGILLAISIRDQHVKSPLNAEQGAAANP